VPATRKCVQPCLGVATQVFSFVTSIGQSSIPSVGSAQLAAMVKPETSWSGPQHQPAAVRGHRVPL
jgi:hypothetical protein